MGKNAYLLISDLHYTDIEKDNRINYQEEIMQVLNKVIELTNKYKSDGYNVIIIFLGDIFDKSFKSVTKGIFANNIFIQLSSIAKIYSVLGNHEITYAKNNPFFTLIKSIDSDKIKTIKRKIMNFSGITNFINVVDILQDGNIIFHFNHFGTEINKPLADKTNIGLFHQDIVPKEVRDYSSNLLKDELYGIKVCDLEENNILSGYRYCYFGHMHKIYGKWEFSNDYDYDKTTLHYLASLGRPNVTEVNDSFLERTIPAIKVHDGELFEIEDNLFNLKSYIDCVKESEVEARREEYAKVKERKRIRDYKASSDSPVRNLLERCKTNEERELIITLLENNIAYYDIIKKTEDIING